MLLPLSYESFFGRILLMQINIRNILTECVNVYLCDAASDCGCGILMVIQFQQVYDRKCVFSWSIIHNAKDLTKRNSVIMLHKYICFNVEFNEMFLSFYF